MDKQYQLSDSEQLPYEWFDENQEIKIQEGIPCLLLKEDKEGKFTADLICPICACILWKPTQCQACQKSFCDGCMANSLAYKSNCPTCRQHIIKGKPQYLLNSFLSKLNFDCPFQKKFGCQATVPYDQFEKHLNKCNYRSSKRHDVKSIEILDYSILKDSFFSRQYISYQIKITEFCEESYHIQKRYSDFVYLHHQLYSDQQLQGKIIPQLPQKCYDVYSLFGYSPSNEEEILERKVNLEIYLRLLCDDPLLFGKNQFKVFLEQNQDDKDNKDEKGVQEKVQEYIINVKKIIDFKDFSLSELQRKFLSLWVNNVQLNSEKLDQNEKLCKEHISMIDELFHYLLKNIYQCQEVMKSISDFQSKKEKQGEQQNNISQHKSTIDQVLDQFDSIIQSQLLDVRKTKQKLYEMIHNIGFFRLKMNGFLEALNKIKQITVECNYCTEQNMKCNDENQKQEINKKISILQKTLETSQKTLELDSDQLKDEITNEIPKYINEFLKEHEILLIQNTDVYEKINKKYSSSNDQLFFKIKDRLQQANS